MKISPVRAELSHAGRQTDLMKQIDSFGNFAYVPKIALIARMEYLIQRNLKSFRTDDSNVVTCCCQDLHGGLKRKLLSDRLCRKD